MTFLSTWTDSGLAVILRRIWTYYLWIYLLVNSEIAGVPSETCVYKRSHYIEYESRYEKTLTTRECQWGCCYDHNSPCCTAPISIIVGCVLGGVLLFALILVSIFCCCVCKRRVTEPGGNAVLRFGTAPNAPGATQQSSVVYHSETSGNVEIPDHVMYDPPPSYEEVMRGEANPAFKPD